MSSILLLLSKVTSIENTSKFACKVVSCYCRLKDTGIAELTMIRRKRKRGKEKENIYCIAAGEYSTLLQREDYLGIFWLFVLKFFSNKKYVFVIFVSNFIVLRSDGSSEHEIWSKSGISIC